MILLKKFNGAFKIFHSFANQEERQNFGGTAFMELQYCTLRPETEIKKIVGVGAHGNWMDSSLYIYLDDIESFCLNYGDIFYGGTYNNLHKGLSVQMDTTNLNYNQSSRFNVKQINTVPISSKIKFNRHRTFKREALVKYSSVKTVDMPIII